MFELCPGGNADRNELCGYGLTAGTTYQYRVRAADAANNLSGYSNVATATTQTSSDTTPPTVPSNLTANATSTTQIDLSWTASTDNVGVTGYRVERCLGTGCSNFTQVATPTGTPYTDSGLTAGTTYQYRVLAVDAANNLSGYSNVATATTQTAGTTPLSLWNDATTPGLLADPDTSAIELGVKFQSDVAGFITGIRFYKSSQNTGTHVGSLWSSAGQLLAQATFSNETASGWQQVNFANPVSIQQNAMYVASYHTNVGRYSVDEGYFASSYTNGHLRALQDGENGGNGVYVYNANPTFPSSTFASSNYWVDVVFTTSTGPDTTPPTVTGRTPAPDATNVTSTASVTATFSEAIDPATIITSTFELRDASSTLIPAIVSYNATNRTATLAPSSPLANETTYTATVKGGSTDPRIKDLVGNAMASNVTWSFTTAAASSDPCASPANPIVAENCLVGNPASEWDISGAGDSSIQGFATDISVDAGETVSFKIDTNASDYQLDIYRMGYYGGDGARKVATVQPSAALPQNQPNCLTNATTGLLDCGNWAVSASWNVPADATSGIYFAKAVRNDTGGASHIVFIVRDDAGSSDILFQTSDTTWQAYNTYGGNSFYTGNGPGTGGAANGRAYKVSYNRPFNTRSVDGGQDWLFNAEYPMVRWLEANGYDVSYFTGVDSDRFGSLIQNHKIFLSVGHDEYWSGNQRANVEAARDAGVHLAFFSGNEVFWKTRWENSYRTLVCYKETHNYPNNPDPQIHPSGPAPGVIHVTARRQTAASRKMRLPARSSRSTLVQPPASECRQRTARCGSGAIPVSLTLRRGLQLRYLLERWVTSGTPWVTSGTKISTINSAIPACGIDSNVDDDSTECAGIDRLRLDVWFGYSYASFNVVPT